MDLRDVLRCPRTGHRLRFDEAAALVRVEHSDLTYPVIEGIIDLCPGPHDRITASYDRVAKRYDPCITVSTVRMKVVGRLIWGVSCDRDPTAKVLALLPERFDGVLLDVPMGTGVFTAPVYSRYPSATVIGVDCSTNMLRKAHVRFREQGVNHVYLVRADAASLPVKDGVVDTILSMNGWHAFGDKQLTVSEMRRVLLRDGRLVACGYVKGARRLSDWFVNRFGVRNGFFTPPFFGFEELDRQFPGFRIIQRGQDQSFAWFEAVKAC